MKTVTPLVSTGGQQRFYS